MHFICIIICLLLLLSLARVDLMPQRRHHATTSFHQSRLIRQTQFLPNSKPSYHEPHFVDDRSVIVHLNEWRFVDIAEECRIFLGPRKFAGVQISPVFEHVVLKAPELLHPWWERYEIISYKIATRSGSEAEFWTMSRICNEVGVRIYVDVPLHHMAARPAVYLTSSMPEDVIETSAGHTVNITDYNYPDVPFNADDFYSSCYPYNQRYCQFKDHPVLNYNRRNVKDIIIDMLNRFIDMGVAGFRIDRANLMQPSELMEIYESLKDLHVDFHFSSGSRPFIYHDVVDLYSDNISKTEYSSLGMVSEYLFALELSTIFNRLLPLTSLINWGPALGFISQGNALVFVDSHNTQRDTIKELIPKQVLTYKQYNKYIMATTFMLFHPYGTVKRLMSSYHFDDNPADGSDAAKQAPTAEDGSSIRSPEFDSSNQCEFSSGWICEHRWPAIVNLLPFVNYFNIPDNYESSIIHFQTGGGFNQVAFCRGSKAFIAINNDPELEFNMQVYTCLQPGEYCDVLTGGLTACGKACNGRKLLVNNDGYAQLNLSVADEYWNYQSEADANENFNERNYGILVIYIATKVNPENDSDECLKDSLDPVQFTEAVSTESIDAVSSTVVAVEITEEITESPTSVFGTTEVVTNAIETTEGVTSEIDNTEGEASEPETTEGEASEIETTEGAPSEEILNTEAENHSEASEKVDEEEQTETEADIESETVTENTSEGEPQTEEVPENEAKTEEAEDVTKVQEAVNRNESEEQDAVIKEVTSEIAAETDEAQVDADSVIEDNTENDSETLDKVLESDDDDVETVLEPAILD